MPACAPDTVIHARPQDSAFAFRVAQNRSSVLIALTRASGVASLVPIIERLGMIRILPDNSNSNSYIHVNIHILLVHGTSRALPTIYAGQHAKDKPSASRGTRFGRWWAHCSLTGSDVVALRRLRRPCGSGATSRARNGHARKSPVSPSL